MECLGPATFLLLMTMAVAIPQGFNFWQSFFQPAAQQNAFPAADSQSPWAANIPAFSWFAPVPKTTTPPPAPAVDSQSHWAANIPAFSWFAPEPKTTTPPPAPAADSQSHWAANIPAFSWFAPVQKTTTPPPAPVVDSQSHWAANIPAFSWFAPVPKTTTPPPKPNSCFAEGKWYGPLSEISRGQTADWCYGSYCNHKGEITYWDDFNCVTAKPLTTPPPPPTTAGYSTAGCWYHGRWYAAGADIDNYSMYDKCYGTYCDWRSTVVHWEDSCHATVPPMQTFPRTTPKPDIYRK